MANPVCELLGCDLPIQLAPMGSVSAGPQLPLAVARAGGHAMYPALALPPAALEPVLDALGKGPRAFGVNFIVPFIDRAALELAVARAPYVDFFLADPDTALVAGIVRLAGAEIPVPRFGAQPPTRESSGHVEAMPFYAGQSAGAVSAIQPAAEIVADLAAGVP
jgi:NAD(P)H-dependent flavin oxidoreductase YrpB (nitropropane dioxygenase family)